MTILSEWTDNLDFSNKNEVNYDNFEELNNLPMAEVLLPEDKNIIGNPYEGFQAKLELLCTFLFEHMDEKHNEDWGKAWGSLQNLADKGYPAACLGIAQISAGLSVGGDVHMARTADEYFEKAKNSPYSSQEMKDYVGNRQNDFNESFDFAYPDLTKSQEAKDFSTEEYTHLQSECDQLMWSAQAGDKNAEKRLNLLAEKGYPQAQEDCGFLAIERGDLQKATKSLESLKNNDTQMEGESLNKKHIGEGLSTAITEKRKGNVIQENLSQEEQNPQEEFHSEEVAKTENAPEKNPNEVDAGYPIRVFDNEIHQSEWLDTVSDSDPMRRSTLISEKLSTQQGQEQFDSFLKTLNSAPELRNLPEQADEDVKLLLIRENYQSSINDLKEVIYTKDSPKKEEALKTLEALSNKGYPQAQSAFAEYLTQEGKTGQARTLLTQLEGNPYASDEEVDNATSKKEQIKNAQPKKSLREILAEASQEGDKQETFAQKAAKAENLSNVSEENLESKISEMDSTIITTYAKVPYKDWKKEDLQALEGLSTKGYPRAQEFLVGYYEDRGQFTNAYNTSDKLRKNPYANEAFKDSGEEHAKKNLPLARKQQAMKPTGRG